MNILIVDDKPSLARVTAVALRTLGCQASTATNTASASQLLATQKFDAMFLDINLGGENGLDYLSQLVTQPDAPAVIMFTSYTKDEVAEEARSRGAFDCLVKPFTLDDLREQLSRLRDHRRPSASSSENSPLPP
ncbi:MAG TPA: response regulator [Lacunisphaera sp.]|nr:response regulator [Lacunisphaera sp.]